MDKLHIKKISEIDDKLTIDFYQKKRNEYFQIKTEKLFICLGGVENSRILQNSENTLNLSKHHFNLWPSGNGLDTHRFWETLLLGVVPVVVLNNHTENFKKLGIPALYLENWKELNSLDEDFLKSFYKSVLSNNSIHQYTNSKFWYEKINLVK